MKAFSLIEPWASLVVMGHKKVETRSWHMPVNAYGTIVAIHASKSREAIDDGTASELFSFAGVEPPDKWPLGCVIGVVRFVRCERTEDAVKWVTDFEREFGNYSEGRFAWVMEGAYRLAKPIPCRGMLGLWDVPPEIEATFMTSPLPVVPR